MSLFWSRVFLIFAGLFGATGVAAGAFAAHGLSALVEPRLVGIFATAAQVQMVHAVALLGLAVLSTFKFFRAWSVVAGLLFVMGILVFSGSLYLRVLYDLPRLGAITPIGGLAFILGWMALGISGWRARGLANQGRSIDPATKTSRE